MSLYTETNDSIFFYKAKGKYGFMSNFWRCEFTDAKTNTKFNCSEQYFMYRKCLLFDPNNLPLLKDILNETSPTAIKRFGRQVRNYNENVWNQERQKCMYDGLVLKFGQNPDLMTRLQATKPKMLYEASKYDRIWGIGYYPDDALHTHTRSFGTNLLGKTLVQLRDNVNPQ